MGFISLWACLLVLATGSLSEGGSLLGLLPILPEVQNANQLLLEVSSLINSVTTTDTNFNISSINPVKVTLPGGGILDLTALYWPIQQICPRTGIVGNLACMFCSNDCTFVHNKFGGTCGTTENTDRLGICLCNESPPTVGSDFTDVVGRCGIITGNADTDKTIDLAIKTLLREGISQYQRCVPQNDDEIPQSESLGCQTDCSFAHGLKSGRCVNGVTPVATFPGETRPGFYCGCFN